MKLIEADGKRLLRDAGIAVPVGFLYSAEKVGEISFPCVLKAQLLSGHRGQRGLVRHAADRADFEGELKTLQDALASIPNGGIYIESEVAHVTEWLLSIDVDRTSGMLRLSYSDQGGMEVADAKSILVTDDVEKMVQELPETIRDTAKRLIALAQQQDALSIEINPLAILADGSVMALDAKVELDDAAIERHPEWESFVRLPATDKSLTEREQAYAAFLEEGGYRGTFGRYVELDGDIALILSGGGASLVALDALQRAGLKAANYCEISGNPDPERTTRAASIVLSHPHIRAIWIAGSFANFTDIQATAMAILAAVDRHGLKISIVIRRDGPNADAAERDATTWAAERGTTLVFHRGDTDLDASAQTLAKILNEV